MFGSRAVVRTFGSLVTSIVIAVLCGSPSAFGGTSAQRLPCHALILDDRLYGDLEFSIELCNNTDEERSVWRIDTGSPAYVVIPPYRRATISPSGSILGPYDLIAARRGADVVIELGVGDRELRRLGSIQIHSSYVIGTVHTPLCLSAAADPPRVITSAVDIEADCAAR